jgi:hypothetical protein
MSAVVPDFGDEPTCTCGDEADDHVFTGGGFCNLCDCERYRPTRVPSARSGQAMTAQPGERWTPTQAATDAADMRAEQDAAVCTWCPGPKLPVWQGGLCKYHWADAHDHWDAS